MIASPRLAAVRNGVLQLPAWALLAQGFLAIGWLRAAVAHGVSRSWWNGEEVAAFAVDDELHPVAYVDFMLEDLVVPTSNVVAALVIVLQLSVALLLALNLRPLLGLAVGSALNVAFILSGAVNPSIFYLALAGVLVVWRLEIGLSTTAVRRLAMALTFGAIAVMATLSPEVTTLDPAYVIDDPAVTLLFLYLLFLATVWAVVGRRELILERPAPAPEATTGEAPSGTDRPEESTRSLPALAPVSSGAASPVSAAAGSTDGPETDVPATDVLGPRCRRPTRRRPTRRRPTGSTARPQSVLPSGSPPTGRRRRLTNRSMTRRLRLTRWSTMGAVIGSPSTTCWPR